MKRITKILALLLTMLLIASTFSVAFALESIDIAGYTSKDYGDCGNGVKWYFAQKDSDPDTILIRGSGAMNNYSQSNPPQWTRLKEKIRHVIVEEGITSVGDYAFAGCPELTKVELSKTVRTIGSNAFANCGALNSLTLPSGLESIGESAFEKCFSLKIVELPSALKTLGRYAFFRCVNLESEVVIPKGVSTVSDSAFFECGSIKSLVLKEGVTAIGNSTFSGCRSLQKVSLPKSLRSLDKSVFSDCSSLTKIEIPEKVSRIPESAFTNCASLSEVSLYNSVHTIEDSAFFGCPIGKIIFYGTSAEWESIWIADHNGSLSAAEQQCIPQNGSTGTAANDSPCKYCGEVHGDSFLQKLTAFFHKILAFFGLKK